MEVPESMQYLGMLRLKLLQFLSPVPKSDILPPLHDNSHDVWDVNVDIFIWNGIKHFVHPSDIPGKCCHKHPEK